ncbi:unnamed protein product [Calicophoron daubneyi]|uniref:Saposin B-type domain-containing protein n=1 Tax=Calicophoron daubneyi TaxID=300641 RepID=A0AAV2TC59_CALDB
MRLLVFLVLISLVAASRLEDEINGRICEYCKSAFDTLYKLVTSHATEEEIDGAIHAECLGTSILQPMCKAALKRAADYIRSHPDETDAATVCKAVDAC